VVRAERQRDRAPVFDRPPQTVDKHERRAVPSDRVMKPGSVPLELSVLESLEPGFAVRHH